MPQTFNLPLVNRTYKTESNTYDKPLKSNLFSQYLLMKNLLPKQDRDDSRKVTIQPQSSRYSPGSLGGKTNHLYHPFSATGLKFRDIDFAPGKSNMEALWKKMYVKPPQTIAPIIENMETLTYDHATTSIRPFIRLSDDAWQRLMNQLKEKGQSLNRMDEETKNNGTEKEKDEVGLELPHIPDLISATSATPDAKLPLPRSLLRKKMSQMRALQNLSKLKAMIHIAQAERQDSQHRREEARRLFLADLAEELQLMSSAKIAELQAGKDYKSLIHAEKLLSDKDRDIHELLDKENSLYEDLTEAEACLARADMNFIPTIKSENELKAFASFLNFGF